MTLHHPGSLQLFPASIPAGLAFEVMTSRQGAQVAVVSVKEYMNRHLVGASGLFAQMTCLWQSLDPQSILPPRLTVMCAFSAADS